MNKRKIQLWRRNSGKFTKLKEELIKCLKENNIKVIELQTIIVKPNISEIKPTGDWIKEQFKQREDADVFKKYYLGNGDFDD